MAIPTSYTAETFATFVKNEILLNVADTMEWPVFIPADEVDPVVETLTLKEDFLANSSVAHFEEDARIHGNPGQVLVFAGADTTEYTVADTTWGTPYPPSDYALRVRLFPYNLADKLEGVTATATYTPTQAANVPTDPVYGYILDEALINLGYDDVTDINADNIMKFRAMARVEAWRAVLSNCVSMVYSEEQEGSNYHRGQVYSAAFEQLQRAEREFDSMYGGVLLRGISATSGSATIRGVW